MAIRTAVVHPCVQHVHRDSETSVVAGCRPASTHTHFHTHTRQNAHARTQSHTMPHCRAIHLRIRALLPCNEPFPTDDVCLTLAPLSCVYLGSSVAVVCAGVQGHVLWSVCIRPGHWLVGREQCDKHAVSAPSSRYPPTVTGPSPVLHHGHPHCCGTPLCAACAP